MSLRCRVGLHDYHRAQNDEGLTFLLCSRCGKEDFPNGAIPPGSNLAM